MRGFRGKKQGLLAISTMLAIALLATILVQTFALPAGERVFVGSYRVQKGSVVSVAVIVSNAESVAGGLVKISFDSSVVEAQRVLAGDFGEPVANVRNDKGFVHLAVARPTAVGKREAVLAVIEFKGVREGRTELRIESAQLNDEKGNLFTPSVSNGLIEVYGGAVTTVVRIGSVEGRQGEVLKVPITISNATGVAGFQLTITFEPSVVEIVAVRKSELTKDFLVVENINNKEGWVKIAASSPKGISGSGEILTLEVRVVGGLGSSTALKIKELKLNDEAGNLFDAISKDGFVKVVGVTPGVVLKASNAFIFLGRNGTCEISLSSVPNGLSGYDIEVTFTPQAELPPITIPEPFKRALEKLKPTIGDVIDVVDVELPKWASLSDVSIENNRVRIVAVDLNDTVRAGDRDVLLAKICVKGKAGGVVQVDVKVIEMNDDNGEPIKPTVTPGFIIVAPRPAPPPIAPNLPPPQDLDGDGLYEDVNGNGRLDFDDIVKLFKNYKQLVSSEWAEFFDFNK
ncbi:MAG: hypothetical protein LM590_15260, partial [Thermofilum sp.]|nr:hypothetical protein [Thermofilum sp.]